MRKVIGITLAVLALASVAYAAYPPRTVVTRQGAISAATATKCPVSPLTGRTGLTIVNGDSASLYVCGASASCSNTTGYEIPAGQALALSVGYDGSSSTTAFTWCYSAAGTTSGEVTTIETIQGPL